MKVMENRLSKRAVLFKQRGRVEKLPHTRERSCGNNKGNKVTETIFTGSREFIMLVGSGEITSQSPEPLSVSGAW
jgi:hypothetical protein